MATASVSSEDSPVLDPVFEPRRGLRLGRYELICRIASGGMAQVWSARQRGDFGFSRVVAVKVIRPELAGSHSFRRMFLDEARLASRIRHPNVVEVIDLGEQGPVVYLAMELIEGTSLTGLLRRARATPPTGRGLQPALAARIVADMASGLHAAHELTDEQGTPLSLVHRDVSPHNILVSLDGITKIADFGIAKAFGRLTDETEAGQLKGKHGYVSPEQAQRQPLDRRSDVFSAGIVLWEALTGIRLFRVNDAFDTLQRVVSAPVPDPRSHAPAVPAALARVAMKALERKPSQRFQTASELSDALEAAMRASHVEASTKQLGSYLGHLVGAEVIAQRAAIRMAETPDLPTIATAGGHSLTVRQWRLPPRAWGVALGASLAVVLGVALAVRLTAATGPTASPAPPPSPGAVPPSITVPVALAPAVSAAAEPPPPPAPSLQPATPHRFAPTSRPAPKPSGPKLPFAGNPY